MPLTATKHTAMLQAKVSPLLRLAIGRRWGYNKRLTRSETN